MLNVSPKKLLDNIHIIGVFLSKLSFFTFKSTKNKKLTKSFYVNPIVKMFLEEMN